MNKEELINLIKTLKISKEEFWILSSGALVLRGIFPDAGDLDIAVTNKGMEEFKAQYKPYLALVVGDGGMKAEDFLSSDPVDLFK